MTHYLIGHRSNIRRNNYISQLLNENFNERYLIRQHLECTPKIILQFLLFLVFNYQYSSSAPINLP